MSHDEHVHASQSSPRRAVYFDPCAGAAGDMINAALIDAGADLVSVQAAITSLGIAGLSAHTEITMKGAVSALRFIVEADDATLPDHLGPDDLTRLIAKADVAPALRARADAIINRIADAEAHVHRTSRDQVHFHELGGLDTIVDVLGAVVALDSLGVAACFTGPLPVNGGTWGMMHGNLPLPAPATLEIIAQAGLAVIAAPAAIPPDKELVTPTGAAILAELARPGLPALTLEHVGYGAGTRDLPVPNVLRAWLGTVA